MSKAIFTTEYNPKSNNDFEINDIQDDYSEETASLIGGSFEIGGVEFPPPTTAFLMFLDLIDSPFIMGGNPSLSDIYNALFVLKFRERAVRDLVGYFNAKKNVNKFEKLVEKSPEYFETYLKYTEKLEEKLAKFKSLAASFGEELGIIDTTQTAIAISDYISSCFGGFEMIPKKENKGDKKKD